MKNQRKTLSIEDSHLYLVCQRQRKSVRLPKANAVKLCGNVCTSDDDAEELRQRMDHKTYEQALIAQLKHWKTSNEGRGAQKRAVLFGYRNLRTSIQELENNLKEIITQIMTGSTQSDDENEPGTSQRTSEDKEDK